jgi:hypothetical protein
MTEQEVRLLVRDAIARHAAGGQPAVKRGLTAVPAFVHLHASHGMFTVPAGAETDGPCIIEPAVMCNHCGYCKSYGH